MSAPATAAAKLDAIGIDDVCEMIASGMSMRRIAERAEVSVGSVANWLAEPERSARARAARTNAAAHWDEEAERVIQDAESDSVEVQRARELAQHYRWRAKAFAPGAYGDRVQVDAKVELTDLTDEALDAKLAAGLAKLGVAP
jgi:hypothetical protein